MKIIDLGMNGEGIAKENGKVFFIKNGLLGEEVDVKILKENKNFTIAKSDKINKKSDDRVDPLCPYFFECGGCQLQHMSYEKQLQFKQNLVKNTLKKVGNIDADVGKTIASKDKFFYRNKSVFPLVSRGGDVYIGMFKENSHDLVDIDECKIAKKGINNILKISREFFKIYNIDGIRYLVVREINNEFLITIVASKNIEIREYARVLRDSGIRFSLDININNDKNKILSNKSIKVYGENFIRLNEYDIKYKIDSLSFMQVNDTVKKKLYDKVLDEIKIGDNVVDSYCGAGLLSAVISNKAKHVYGIEISKSAIENANKLAIENGIKNITFICGDCKREIPKLLPNIEADFTIILDPPRSGCDEFVLRAIIDTKPSKVVYISCNPITLAKDLKTLLNVYKIEKITPFDMFPQTANVETLVVLKKSSN